MTMDLKVVQSNPLSVISLSDALENIEEANECFPRCEYCFRYEGTSAFNMSNSDFWGTYFRSTSRGGNYDRLSKVCLSGDGGKNTKAYNNLIINKSIIKSSQAGLFYSPWSYIAYRKIFNPTPIPKITNIIESYLLYDVLLKYKNEMVNKVCKLTSEYFMINSTNRKINFYHCNDYPCLMVTVPGFNSVPGEKGSLYSISCAYFVAICNHTAKDSKVPIEIVMRSSFGHNLPSIAETSNSLRINIGLVPNIYCNIVAESLWKFNNNFLLPLINEPLKENDSLTAIIENHNEAIKKYNDIKACKKNVQIVDSWSISESLFTILCKKGDSRGSKVSFQISRMNKYLDVLVNYVSQELKNPQNGEINLFIPLIYVLNHLTYDSMVTLNVDKSLYIKPLDTFSFEANECISTDNQFWEIIQLVAFALKVGDVDYLEEAIKHRQIYGLYSKLECANLRFIRNSSYITASDGNGSDSDCEINEVPHLYCKKLIVSTGIRAINVAHFTAMYRMRQCECKVYIDTTFMYYETSHSIKNVFDILSPLANNNETLVNSGTIHYIDLNHCAASGEVSVILQSVNISTYDIIILDYTSTQVENIHDAVKLFIQSVPFIILINSGIKNEQVGADMNPYGTVRIVSKDLSLLNELFFVMIQAVKSEILPKHAHCIRKAYKHIGAVVTYQTIFKGKYLYKKSQYVRDSAAIQSILSTDEFQNILKFMNDNEFRDKICLLIDSGLEYVIISFVHFDNLNNLPDSVINLCELSDDFSLSSAINTLSFDEMSKLFKLLKSHTDELNRLLGQYGIDILEVLDWESDFISFIGSVEVEIIVKDTFTDIDDIVSCVLKDDDITHSIIKFCSNFDESYVIFSRHNFGELFESLYDIKFKKNIDEGNSSSSENSSIEYNWAETTSCNSIDEYFCCEDELWVIYWENVKNDCPTSNSSYSS